MSTPSSATSQGQLGSIAIIGALFFIFGFVTWLNGPLITFAQLAFELDEVTAFLILTAFFLSYFFLAIPSSWILKRTGMKKGLALGLFVMAIGAALFVTSDSLIVLNAEIGIELPRHGFLVMLTYLAAQWLIVRGLVLWAQPSAPQSGQQGAGDPVTT